MFGGFFEKCCNHGIGGGIWANWAKGKLGKLLFSMCIGNVTNYKYNIYNNKYNIYIIFIIN